MNTHLSFSEMGARANIPMWYLEAYELIRQSIDDPFHEDRKTRLGPLSEKIFEAIDDFFDGEPVTIEAVTALSFTMKMILNSTKVDCDDCDEC